MRDALQRLRATLSASLARVTGKQAFRLRLHRGRWLALVFAPLLLAILVNGYLAMRSLNTLTASERLVSHSRAVLAQIRAVESQLVDAESAERGYLLTGNASYLASYTAAHVSLASELAQLRTLTAGDTAQHRRLAAVEPLFTPLFDEWQWAIDLRAQQRIAESIAVTSADKVQQTIVSTRARLAEMSGVEANLRDSRLRAASGSLIEAQATMLVASSADVVLLLVLFALVWRAFAARERHLREEQAARATAEAAVALRNEFLSIASHELRTPVAVLLGNTQLLERVLLSRVKQDTQVRRSFGAIQRQLTRIQALIAAMLDVSRIERGHLKIAHDPLDLVALVEAVVDEMRTTTQAHPIELVVPTDAPLDVFVYGDALRLEQVMFNLLQNAIKYSPDGGPIQVKVARADNWASVAVTDHGLGIVAEALPHLFERFYRAPGVRSEHISGLGIGLFIVHEIVTLHGGDVSVVSEQGTGTSVTVRLPLAAPVVSAVVSESAS
ncbi:MAG TPA: ATP-binding protein [Ktedonobacterales bacterium]|nr:ATP-binding protein [Ktedonobacterales bacterium]